MMAWEDTERRASPGRLTGEEVLFEVGMLVKKDDNELKSTRIIAGQDRS